MHKRIIAGLSAVAIAFGAVGVPAAESGVSFGRVGVISASANGYGDFDYTVLDDGTIEITKYYGTYSDVEIPAKINGTAVTSIGSKVFQDLTSVSTVIIPDSVTNIDSYAFYNCGNLTSITIPDSVTNIGEWAFSSCDSLTSVTIGNGVTSIGIYAFDDCTSLTSITISNSVTSIEDYAFKSCTSLENITIPNSVTNIGYFAFKGCTSLANITIPDSVTSIGYFAFSDTKWLENKQNENPFVIVNGMLIDGTTCSGDVVIPNSVRIIGDDAFYKCTNLTSVTIPNSVTSIEWSTFEGCTSLTNVTIPNSVTSIGYYAFEDCISLTSITIPDSVTYIGYSAFYNCTNLTSVTIPKSVTSIGWYAFGYYTSYNKYEDFKIYCYSGTEGETYAQKNGFEYEILSDHTHKYTAKVTKTATCTTTGTKTYTCSCDDSYTESIPATGHTVVTDKALSATCTTDGKTGGLHCSVCGTVITAQKTIPATGHTAVTDKAVAATCTTDGKTEGSHCSVCGKVITAQQTISKKAHSYEKTVVKPTVSTQGYTLYKCKVCGTSYKNAYVAKLIAISNAKISIPKYSYTYTGKAITPTVTVKYNGTTLTNGNDYQVSYSSNKNIGTAKITVTGKGAYTGTATKTFKIAKKSTTITGLSSFTKYSNAKPFKLNQKSNGGKLSYKSSNTKVVTVNSNGVVTIKGAGKANITVTSTATNTRKQVTKTIKINIKKYYTAKSISFSRSSYSLYYGGMTPYTGTLSNTATLTAKVNPSAHTGKVTYKSSNPSIVSVTSNGKITAHGVGTVTITATIDGKKATCKVTSHERPTFSTSCSAKTLSSTSKTSFRLDNFGSKSIKILSSSKNFFLDPNNASYGRYIKLIDKKSKSISSYTIASDSYGSVYFKFVDSNGNAQSTRKNKTGIVYFEFTYDGVKYIGYAGYNVGSGYMKE
jgi:hypothetical protein